MNSRPTQVTIVKKELHKLLSGEMTHHTKNYYTQNHSWYLGCPGCDGVANLGNHTVTESDTGITVSPSILCGCGAHYFVENNQIRWCN